MIDAWERGEQRTIRADDGSPIGFVRFTEGGLWRAYSYRGGVGFGPFASEADASTWVTRMRGPIAGYSR